MPLKNKEIWFKLRPFPRCFDAGHQRSAAPIHTLIVVTFGLLALASIAGGVIAIMQSSKSNTEFSLLGAKLSTGDVGVALVGIGLVIAYFTVRAVLKSIGELAALPPDKSRKR
jgi:hypothetical protein